MTCPHRTQVNESPVLLSVTATSKPQKCQPLIGRRQYVHRTALDFASADRESQGVLIPRRYSLQSFVRSLTAFSNSALCFRSCQRSRSSAYAVTCIIICSRHSVMQLCWTLTNSPRQFCPWIIDPLFPPSIIPESDHNHEFLIIQRFLHFLCRWEFRKRGAPRPRNRRITLNMARRLRPRFSNPPFQWRL